MRPQHSIPYNPSPLLQTLRTMPVGGSLLVQDKTIKRAGDFCRAARRGTGKHFTCRTTTAGVKVWRLA